MQRKADVEKGMKDGKWEEKRESDWTRGKRNHPEV